MKILFKIRPQKWWLFSQEFRDLALEIPLKDLKIGSRIKETLLREREIRAKAVSILSSPSIDTKDLPALQE